MSSEPNIALLSESPDVFSGIETRARLASRLVSLVGKPRCFSGIETCSRYLDPTSFLSESPVIISGIEMSSRSGCNPTLQQSASTDTSSLGGYEPLGNIKERVDKGQSALDGCDADRNVCIIFL